MSEHPSITRFRSQLQERRTAVGLDGSDAALRIVVLPDSVHTAALAAEALGCQIGAIANSLLFKGDDEPVLVLTSGAHRVDTEKVAGIVGVSALKRATPEFVRQHTGQVIGGVSPVGHPAPVRTFLDTALRAYPELWAAAGHPAAVFAISYDDLRAITGATEIEVN